MDNFGKYLSTSLIRVFFILVICSVGQTLVYANSHKIDSLRQELTLVKEDTNRIKLWLDISWEYHTSQPRQTIIYAQKAYQLSKDIYFKKGEASSLNMLGIGHDVQGNLDEALHYYKTASTVGEEMKHPAMIRNCLNNIGLILQRKGDYEASMKSFHKALEMTDEDKEPGMTSVIFNNIGIIHYHEGRYAKAKEYFEYSLKIERETKNDLGISMALTNIGEQYRALDQNAKALIYYKEALDISKRIGDKVGEAILLSNMGELHYENGLLDLSEELYPQALDLASEVGDKGTMCLVLNNMAKLQQKRNHFQSSIKYAQEGLLLARQMGDKKQVTDIFETLTKSYVGIKDFESAYKYQSLFNQAKDSLFSAEKSKQILELSTQYETKRKETENRLLKEQQAKNEAIIQRRTIVGMTVAITLLLMCIIATILFRNNRQKKKHNLQLENEVANRTSDLEESNAKLRNSNKELERFAYIASHDLKEPLRNIMSFTRLVERKLPPEAKENEDVKEYMSHIVNNTKQMHQLIEDVLEYSRIDNAKPESEIMDVNDIIKSVINVLSSTLKERNVKVNIGKLPKVKANASQLFLVLKNLVENGIKYNENEHPVISVFSVQNDQMHEISVMDNGIGIEEKYFKRIFGMFKRLHNREEYQGSGLGLSICKKIVQHLGGDIWVESPTGEGSKFTFSLPVVEAQKTEELNLPEVSTHENAVLN